MRHVNRGQKGRHLVCLGHSGHWARELIIEWGGWRWGIIDLMGWEIVWGACEWRGTREVGAGSGSGNEGREEL